jgi:hypothetical protein
MYQQPQQPQQQHHPTQAAPQTQPAQQAQQPGGVVISGEMIVGAAPQLEQALAAGIPASIVAEQFVPSLVQQLGKENTALLIQALSPERVVQELQNAGLGASPLVRRAGQRFLRELNDECAKALSKM